MKRLLYTLLRDSDFLASAAQSALSESWLCRMLIDVTCEGLLWPDQLGNVELMLTFQSEKLWV